MSVILWKKNLYAFALSQNKKAKKGLTFIRNK